MLYGVHYEYPFGGMCMRAEWLPKGPEDYARDLDAIKDTGFDSLRTRIGFDSDLDDVQMLIDMAHQRGLKILFGFATFYVHDDFVRQYPDSKIVGADGSVVPENVDDLRWQRACIDHPEYRRRRDQLLRDCVERFAAHPAVFAWCVHNEPSIGPVEFPCYCEHTLAKYRINLMDRFGGLEEMNDALGTAFSSEEAVVPPRTHAENPAFWVDWRTFMVENLSRFLNEGRDIIRAHVAADVPVTYNVTYPYNTAQTGQDWWNIGQLNLRTASKYMTTTEFSMQEDIADLALLKSMGCEGEPVWLTEFQGGMLLSPNRRVLYTSADIDLCVHSAIANGVKGLYIYRWEPLLSGPEPLVNGLTEADYIETERRAGMRATIAALREDEAFLDSAIPMRARVAVYVSRGQCMRASMRGLEQTLKAAEWGAYALLTDMGYEVRYLTSGFRADCGYEAVFFPWTADLDVDITEIREYTRRGGRVILDLPVFEGESEARAFSQVLEMGVDRVQHLRYLLFSGWDLRGAEGTSGPRVRGYAIDFRAALAAGAGRVLLRYGDTGEGALALPDGFDGRLLASGFALGYSYARTLHHGIRQILADFLSPAVTPDIRLDGVNKEVRPYLEARVLSDGERSMLFVINRCAMPFKARIMARGSEPVDVDIKPYGATKLFL